MLSSRLALSLLDPFQSLRHITINESFERLDTLVQMVLQATDQDDPPMTPEDGTLYAVGSSPTGVWTEHSGQIAAFRDNVWSFISPQSGWSAWKADSEEIVVFDGSAWVVHTAGGGGSTTQTPQLGINTSADASNRLSVKSDAVLFSHDDQTPGGGNITLSLNRVDQAHSANLQFQDNYVTQAEFGYVQTDGFQIKIRDANDQFVSSLSIDPVSGTVQAPQNLVEPRRNEVNTTHDAGGTDWWGPADPMVMISNDHHALALSPGRIYFSAIFVPQRIDLLGGFISQHVASTDAGALLRAGLYELGTPSGNNWAIGDLVVDLGTVPADIAGNKIIDLASPFRVEPGWYAIVLGTDGSGATVRASQWHTPGLARLMPRGSGTSAFISNSGAGYYLWEASQPTFITGGYPQVFSTNPVFTIQTISGAVQTLFIPKWRRVV